MAVDESAIDSFFKSMLHRPTRHTSDASSGRHLFGLQR